jgi:glutamine synthetase
MLREALVFVGTCDIAGHVLGKGFPARAIEARRQKGVGWTHSNLMQTAFGPIFGTPFGTAGDLMIVPEAEVRLDFADGSVPEHFFLGDICNIDGTAGGVLSARIPVACGELPRGSRRLIAAFEREFAYTGNENRPGDADSLSAFRRQGVFGGGRIAALRAAGVEPDTNPGGIRCAAVRGDGDPCSGSVQPEATLDSRAVHAPPSTIGL